MIEGGNRIKMKKINNLRVKEINAIDKTGTNLIQSLTELVTISIRQNLSGMHLISKTIFLPRATQRQACQQRIYKYVCKIVDELRIDYYT